MRFISSRAARLRRIGGLLIMFVLLMGTGAGSVAHAQAPTSPIATGGKGPPLANFLRPDGTLNLHSGFSGSLDPSGWTMQTGADGSPRFVPAAPLSAGDAKWDDRFTLPGTNGPINALAVSGSILYVGGDFTSAGPVAANNIAAWDGNVWRALGSDAGQGVSGSVNALAVSGGTLYVGGAFTSVGGTVPASDVAAWDGGAWSALGSGANEGVNSTVNVLAVSSTGILYAGGAFTSAAGGTVPASFIATWDGNTWSALGSGANEGVSSYVNALAVSGSTLYAGGAFSSAAGGTVPASHIAAWNSSTGTWSALGSGANEGVSSYVYALAVSGSTLYVGGTFSSAAGGTVPASHIAAWHGSTWTALGSGANQGVNGAVNALAVNGSTLYVGGGFSSAAGGAVAASYAAAWNGTTWSALGSGAQEGVNDQVNALAMNGSTLYVGGAFTNAAGGTAPASYVAAWNTSAWATLGGSADQGVNGAVYALAVSKTGILYVGGFFTSAGSAVANNIAAWDGSAWTALGSGSKEGVNDQVNALAMSGSTLYVGGFFTSAAGGTVPASYVAAWDGSMWSALGSGSKEGLNGAVYALAVSGSTLYAGGAFTSAAGETVPTSYVAAWDGSTWGALGSGSKEGVDSYVYALAVSGSTLYVGGTFSSAAGGTVAANNIASWDGSTWGALGSSPKDGVDGSVNALAVSGSLLYAGGAFTSAAGGTIPASYIATWDGSAWAALGSGAKEGVNDQVNALAVSGSTLYVGGAFSSAAGGTVPANNIATWDGSAWATLGSGMDSSVFALAPSGADTVAGGVFGAAGGKGSSNFSIYHAALKWATPPAAVGAALAAPGLYFDSSQSSQVFTGGTSGVKAAYDGATGTPLWAQPAGAAVYQRGPIIPIGGSNVVFFTDGSGYVNALNAADGSVFWPSVNIGAAAVAGVAYEPALASPSFRPLILAGTSVDSVANQFVALDAADGAPKWAFSNGGSLGLVTTNPAVDPANHRVFFGTKNATSPASGGGFWALNTDPAAPRLLWSRTDLGSANSGYPTLSDDGSTLYIALNGGTTLYALNAADGTNKAGWAAFSPGGSFAGAPWLDGTTLYVTAGDTVYALDASTGARLWSASVPGAGTPLVLSDSHNAVYVSSNNGFMYKLDLDSGAVLGEQYLNTREAAASNLTYDVLRNVFYVVGNGYLSSIDANW